MLGEIFSNVRSSGRGITAWNVSVALGKSCRLLFYFMIEFLRLELSKSQENP